MSHKLTRLPSPHIAREAVERWDEERRNFGRSSVDARAAVTNGSPERHGISTYPTLHFLFHNRVLEGKAILVVDDNLAVLETLADILEQAGAEVGPCLDPADALRSLQEDPAGWDLVLTDYDMPGVNGAQLAHALRQVRPSLPITLLSALPLTIFPEHLGLCPFNLLLSKPVKAGKLIETVAVALGCDC